ncbi:CheB methylesterase domain-containing protein [Geomonas sp. RF6]|uniref:CheB methylesterase domain-containing protein n=1 Tax=Geomonas sp. RF6 TaxID=2897342 RepID=UPI001E5F932C|nr:CheB methylesterase domain-containing protein [Geomonas sp. RF6]UFS69889.1 CheB methylesterase domain-containing protein [Geomonas sp. RF6]
MSKRNVVVIGVSTGGPPTLEELFSELPPVKGAIIVVQHVAAIMDSRIAKALDKVSAMPVSLAEDGAFLWDGQVYVAPGGYHLALDKNQQVRLIDGPRVNYVQPAVDVTMMSLDKQFFGGKIIGIILTGMGKDGAEGIRHIKGIGGVTIAQDKETSIIFGMPKAAADTGAVDYVLSPKEIAAKLVRILGPLEEGKPVQSRAAG